MEELAFWATELITKMLAASGRVHRLLFGADSSKRVWLLLQLMIETLIAAAMGVASSLEPGII